MKKVGEEVGLDKTPIKQQVLHLAQLAKGAGVDGVVASSQEAKEY